MSSPQNRHRRSAAPRSHLFTAALATALTLNAGIASANDRSPVDVLSSVVAPAPTETIATRHARETVSVHPSEQLGVPALLTAAGKAPKLAGAMQVASDPGSVARIYLKHYADLYRVSPAEIDALPISNVQRLDSGATLVRFDHVVNGIEVFRERTAVMFDADGELAGIGGTLSGSGSISSIAKSDLFRLSPAEVLGRALGDFGFDPASVPGRLSFDGERDRYSYYRLSATASEPALLRPARVKPVFFRTAEGLVPAYYLEIQVREPGDRDDDYYAYVISAKSGALLFRHDLTQHATAFGYRVWAETAFPYLPLPSPQGRNATPHPTASPDGYQPPFVAPNLVTLLNALPPTSVAHDDPWLPDGATATLGNNVHAWANHYIPSADPPNSPPPDGYEPDQGDIRPDVTGPNVFDRVFNPNQSPLQSADQVKAATTQLFYVNNWLHDAYYDVGFDEAAGNAQQDNYGRGGVEADRIEAHAQDGTGRNNASMQTPADGASPIMRMYVFDGASAARIVFTGGLNSSIEPRGAVVGAATPSIYNVQGQVVHADDGNADGGGSVHDACQPLTNATALAGKVALIELGSCNPGAALLRAQDAGAVAALFYQTDLPEVGAIPASEPTITIPALFVSNADIGSLLGALQTGAVTSRLERSQAVERDGTIDNGIVSHEWGHYISGRLVQNAAGLNSSQAGGMGEGFADFHALLMLVKPEDALIASNAEFGGTYAAGGYVIGGKAPGDWVPDVPNQAYYYGVRRYPYSTNFSKNPLTLKHVENGVPLPSDPPPSRAGSPNAEVHNTGEVWATALWECYTALLRDHGRLTFAQAQQRMKSYLVAGYQLMPPAPNFMEARDAILTAARANDPTDFQLCASGFARRGFGAAALPPVERYGSDNAGVVESFSTGPAARFDTVGLADAAVSCDNDGILDNGEVGTLTIPFSNSGFQPWLGGTITLSSPDPTVSLPQSNYTLPTLDVFESTAITVPIALNGATGTPVITVNIAAAGNSLASTLPVRYRVNSDSQPAASATDAFETAFTPWAAMVGEGLADLPGNKWRTRAVDGDPASHSMFGPDLGERGLTSIVTPALAVSTSQPFSLTFQHRHEFEFEGLENYDGGVIEISEDGGTTWTDVVSAGGSLTPSYNGTIQSAPPQYPAFVRNPLEGRTAFVNTNAANPDFDSVTLNFGMSMAGKTVLIRFVIGTDFIAGAAGWDIDNVAVSGITGTPFPMLVADPDTCSSDTIFRNGFE